MYAGRSQNFRVVMRMCFIKTISSGCGRELDPAKVWFWWQCACNDRDNLRCVIDHQLVQETWPVPGSY